MQAHLANFHRFRQIADALRNLDLASSLCIAILETNSAGYSLASQMDFAGHNFGTTQLEPQILCAGHSHQIVHHKPRPQPINECWRRTSQTVPSDQRHVARTQKPTHIPHITQHVSQPKCDRCSRKLHLAAADANPKFPWNHNKSAL